MHASLYCYPTLEVRGVFLDISKTFDRVWHEALIYKIKSIGISGPLLKLIESFLSNRYQRVLFNGQSSTCLPIIAGVLQGSILGPLFFLMYINDLSKNLSSITKLFADDTSIFSVVHDVDLSAKQLNDDLNKISDWVFQWKMAFNPDLSKQVQKIVFSHKTHKISRLKVNFNNSPVAQSTYQKHLGLYLDEKINFIHHIKEKISKPYRGIGVIKKLRNNLPRQSLLTICKSFIRPHLDYGDVVYDQSYNETFCSKLESVQYNAALAITGAIRGTSQTKLYVELGLESLKARRWFRRLCYFYKLKSYGIPPYLFQLTPQESHSYNARNSEDIPTYHC